MNYLQQSIISELSYEAFSKRGLYRVPSSNTSHRFSNQNFKTHKLEGIVSDYAKTIKANKPVIEQLQCQRRFFRRICEKQNEKIQRIDLSLLREEYESEFFQLRQRRNKMHQIITRLHEEAEEKRYVFHEMSKCLTENTRFLEASLMKMESENANYSQILQQKKEIVRIQEQRLAINAQNIVEKERIEQKYNLIRDRLKENSRYQNLASTNDILILIIIEVINSSIQPLLKVNAKDKKTMYFCVLMKEIQVNE